LAVIALAVSAGGLNAEDGLDIEIPEPENSQVATANNFRLAGRNINGVGYKSQESLYRIEAYYNNFFSKEGFKRVLNTSIGGTKTKRLQFRKENLVVDIVLTPKEDGTEVGIAKYTLPENVKRIEDLPLSLGDSLLALPKKDSKGKDPDSVPRPPESTRLPSINFGAEVYYTYFSKSSVAEVNEFYKREMPLSGWEMAKEIDMNQLSSDYKRITGKEDFGLGKGRYFLGGEVDLAQAASNSYILDFVDGDNIAKITISPNALAKNEGSIVQILLNEKK